MFRAKANKIITAVWLALLTAAGLHAQTGQQQLHYRIDLTLQADTKTAEGMWQLDYSNNSNDTLFYVWMHLPPNAWRNDRTACSEQLLQLRKTDFYFSEDNEKGYINRLSFRANGKLVPAKDHPLHQDIIQLALPEPLAPGGTVHLETPFHLKIPKLYDRFGYGKDFILFTDWFPRAAVYDVSGWHPMPYLAQGPQYQDAASFEVNIQAGNGWKVISPAIAASDATGNLFQFVSPRQIDFTWIAYKNRPLQTIAAARAPRTRPAIHYLGTGSASQKEEPLPLLENTLDKLIKRLGSFPYPSLILLAGAGQPAVPVPGCIVLPAKKIDALWLEKQLLLQYAYSINIDHRQEPAIAGGLTNYLESPASMRTTDKERWQFSASQRLDMPVTTPADSLPPFNLQVLSIKAGEHYREYARSTGQPVFDSTLKNSFTQYRFRRPPAGWISIPADSGLTVKPSGYQVSFFPFSKPDPAKNHFGILPALGYNRYDGFMAGLLFHNLSTWMPRFQYLVAAMYGVKSKAPVGIADLRYTVFGNRYRGNWQLGLQAARFHRDELGEDFGNLTFAFSKIAPYLRWQLPETDPWSARERTIQFKSFFITEENMAYDSIGYRKSNDSRQLQQLFLRWADNRELYPYDYNLQIDYQPAFTRIAWEGNYFFNYRQRDRGFQVRVFAGKFIYNQSTHNPFEAERYGLNLTGPNGYEDYTYSGYYAGRNAFSGWQSQQIGKRDGFFKVRTDLLNSKIGKSDDWLVALNLTTDIPDGVNPLSLLPVRVPVRLFADLGSFSNAWSEDYDDQRILFDAGFQVTFFKELLQVYIPVIASKPFRDYNKSVLGEKRFWKTISFAVDLEGLRKKPWLSKIGL